MANVFPTVRSPEVKLSIQLEKLLQQHFHGKPWGLNEKIHKKTGLSKAKIRALRTNAAKSISIDTLQKIIGYLVNECHISPTELLGTFFGVQPSGFWTMFGSSTGGHFKVQICEGVRNDPGTAEPRWINAYDAYLSATFIRQLVAIDARWLPDLEQCLFRAYFEKQPEKEAFTEARGFYHQFRGDSGGRALACVGSMKSLPLSECVLADVFNVQAFQPQAKVDHLRQRAIPLFFRYREDDPHPPSAFGGRNFPLASANGLAGVAYEVDADRWDFCPTTETEDAGVVFYVCRLPENTVELVLAGFSGRATGCIALDLPALADQLWPPQYQEPDLMVGAFIIRFEFPPPPAQPAEPHPILVPPCGAEVVPLSGEVLARRLAGTCSASSPPVRGPKKPGQRKPR